MSMPPEAPSAVRKARQKPTPAARKAGERVKRTIVLSRDLDVRLGVLAAVRGVDCSALVAEMIAPHLRGVVVSLRGRAGDEPDTVAIGETIAA